MPSARWEEATQRIKSDPQLREDIFLSVVTSMELAGFGVDRKRAEEIFEEALTGPELVLL